MKCEVLVSTMNKKNAENLIEKMNIKNCVIVNQVTENINYQKDNLQSNQKFITYKEKGLSKSRNKAIEHSSADICIIADDDMYYESEYENYVLSAYQKHPDADLIAFVVSNEDSSKYKKILTEGKKGYLSSMKISSVQITFKRKSIVEHNIKLDEDFGTGSKYYWGEENIFLFDCLKRGLKLYYVPKKIATLRISESSWNKDNTPEHYQIQGAIYYRMSNKFYPLLIMQFALRKRKIYNNDMTITEVIKNMFIGAKNCKYKNLKD